jgi:mono/diheme cytochrome c family protein
MKWSRHGCAILCLSALACSRPDGDLPPEYRRASVPEQRLATAKARERGRELFLSYCALCHGERADGRGARSQGLSTRPADFTDPEWRRRTSPRRVFFRIREGVPGTAMPSWKPLGEDEAWDLVAYLASLGDDPGGRPR